eukprot:TRINITY_DN19517_c0_g1_i1.p1 TRINITY_DN19517_c0_g1~~TRINITY_DN19517_c0_g1_i1.p1  ORF type:complete len:1114 (-),score=297.32 TRINITY_DN19517_c0_g1_i1:377-3718(-)
MIDEEHHRQKLLRFCSSPGKPGFFPRATVLSRPNLTGRQMPSEANLKSKSKLKNWDKERSEMKSSIEGFGDEAIENSPFSVHTVIPFCEGLLRKEDYNWLMSIPEKLVQIRRSRTELANGDVHPEMDFQKRSFMPLASGMEDSKMSFFSVQDLNHQGSVMRSQVLNSKSFPKELTNSQLNQFAPIESQHIMRSSQVAAVDDPLTTASIFQPVTSTSQHFEKPLSTLSSWVEQQETFKSNPTIDLSFRLTLDSASIWLTDGDEKSDDKFTLVMNVDQFVSTFVMGASFERIYLYSTFSLKDLSFFESPYVIADYSLHQLRRAAEDLLSIPFLFKAFHDSKIFSGYAKYSAPVMELSSSLAEVELLVDIESVCLLMMLDSLWMTKLPKFFIPLNNDKNNLSPSTPKLVSNSVKAKKKVAKVDKKFAMSVNLFDIVVDFNPSKVNSRLVFAVDYFSFSTSFLASSTEVLAKLSIENVGLHLAASAPKNTLRPLSLFISSEMAIHESDALLRNMQVRSIAELVSQCDLVNTGGFTFCDFDVKSNLKTSDVEIRAIAGKLNCYMCKDSLRMFVNLLGEIGKLLEVRLKMEDVEVSYKDEVNLLGEALSSNMTDSVSDLRASSSGLRARPHSQRQSYSADYRSQVKSRSSISVIDDYSSVKQKKKNYASKVEAKWLVENPVSLVIEDYFAVKEADLLDAALRLPKGFPKPKLSLLLKGLDLCLRLFGGCDFPDSSVESRSVSQQEEEDGNEFSGSDMEELDDPVVTFDVLELSPGAEEVKSDEEFLTVDFAPSQPATKPVEAEKAAVPAEVITSRRSDEVIEVAVTGICVRLDQFDKESRSKISSRISLVVKEYEVRDCFKKSEFTRMVCRYRVAGKVGVDLSHPFMVHLVLAAVRSKTPGVAQESEEYRVKLFLSSLRVNIDQDTLSFLDQFLEALEKDDSKGNEPEVKDELQTPVPYVQKFSVSSFSLCMDYRPKRMNYGELSKGDYGQLVHLFPLHDVEIELKTQVLSGIYGFDRLFSQLIGFWSKDVAANQSHKYLSGIRPIRSLINIGSGMADLVIVPIRQVRKDGKLLKGIQKGSSSAVQSVAVEAIDLVSFFVWRSNLNVGDSGSHCVETWS